MGFAHTPSELTSGGMEMQNSFVSMLEFIFRPSARQRDRDRDRDRNREQMFEEYWSNNFIERETHHPRSFSGKYDIPR